MTRKLICLLLATGFASMASSQAAPHHVKKVSMYQAITCKMLYTPQLANKYHYVCPGSHSKMVHVMVTPMAAHQGMVSTLRELASIKHPSHRH